MAQSSPDPNRKHRLTFYLSDSELRTFKQSLKYSNLNQSEFIRRRVLQVTRRRQIPLSLIEIYRRLGLLQRQTEALLAVTEGDKIPTGGLGLEVKGMVQKAGMAKVVGTTAELATQMQQLLSEIKALRAEVVGLDDDA